MAINCDSVLYFLCYATRLPAENERLVPWKGTIFQVGKACLPTIMFKGYVLVSSHKSQVNPINPKGNPIDLPVYQLVILNKSDQNFIETIDKKEFFFQAMISKGYSDPINCHSPPKWHPNQPGTSSFAEIRRVGNFSRWTYHEECSNKESSIFFLNGSFFCFYHK